MRFLFLLCALANSLAAATPERLEAALKTFRTDAPRGWSFTQTTAAEGKTRVERYDAAQPDFNRWTLVTQDGRAPTDEEQARYKQVFTSRSRGGTAPLLTDQIDATKAETVSDTAERATYRCPMKPGEAGDKTAQFLRVTLVVHKATGTIESVEIGSTGEFSPTFGVKIAEMQTKMTYSVPNGDTPSLPQAVTTRLRGKAFLFKSLDAEMTVTYSDFKYAGKKVEK